MLIKIAKPSDLHESDVTPESIYLSRRRFMGGMAGLGAGLALSGVSTPAMRIPTFPRAMRRLGPRKNQRDRMAQRHAH